MTDELEKLLEDFRKNREDLRKMIDDLEKYKDKLDKIFPETTMDYKFRHLFEEKVKAVTSFFTSLLDVRKEINKSLKDEMDLRRKIELEENQEGEFDISEMADRIDKMMIVGRGE